MVGPDEHAYSLDHHGRRAQPKFNSRRDNSGDLQRMLRVLRAEGYSREKIAAFAAKWREQRGGGSGKGR